MVNIGLCAVSRYWHRSLNPKKLIEVKFSHLSRNMTMQRHVKLYRLPDATKTEGLRQLKSSDIPAACKLLNEVMITATKLLDQMLSNEPLLFAYPKLRQLLSGCFL